MSPGEIPCQARQGGVYTELYGREHWRSRNHILFFDIVGEQCSKTQAVPNGPRPLKSTGRHGHVTKGLVTCNMGPKNVLKINMRYWVSPVKGPYQPGRIP